MYCRWVKRNLGMVKISANNFMIHLQSCIYKFFMLKSDVTYFFFTLNNYSERNT